MKRVIIVLAAAAAVALPALGTNTLLWSYDQCNGVYAAADLGDVNGDGKPDVVCAKYYSDAGDELFALSGANGAKLWAANDCLGTWGTHALDTVADLNGDGKRDVILGSPGGVSEGRSFYLKSGADGATLFTYSTYSGPNDGWVYAVAGIADVNNNGKADLLAAAGGNSNNHAGTVFCFDGGSRTGSIQTLWTFRPADAAMAVCALGDVTGDDIADVAFGAGGNSYDNRAYGLNGATGAKIWEYNTGSGCQDIVNMGDLNGDGADDCAVGGWARTVIGLNGKTGAVLWSYNVGQTVTDLEKVPDVNGDGKAEVLVGAWGANMYMINGADGQLLQTYPIAADCWSVDVVQDFSGDGKWDVVGGALGGGAGVAQAYTSAGESWWRRSYAERVYDVERVGDMTGDGIGEVCVCLQDQNHEQAHVWLFDMTGDTGIPDPKDPGTAAPRSPYAFALGGARPNPCRGEAHIAFSLPAAANARLELFDLAGRKVRTLAAGSFAAGEHEATADTATLAPGVYIYRLTAGNNAAAKRLVISR